MKEILIIEDDPEIIKLLEIHLTDLIYQTSMAADAPRFKNGSGKGL